MSCQTIDIQAKLVIIAFEFYFKNLVSPYFNIIIGIFLFINRHPSILYPFFNKSNAKDTDNYPM